MVTSGAGQYGSRGVEVQTTGSKISSRMYYIDSPGGSVVKNLLTNAGDTGFDP